MPNNLSEISKIGNITNLKEFIKFNEKIGSELEEYKPNFKLGYSSTEHMIPEIAEGTKYSSYVYKKIVTQLFNSKKLSEDDRKKLEKEINYDYKSLVGKNKDGQTIHIAKSYVGYNKVYDTKNFCDLLVDLAKKCDIDLDEVVKKESNVFFKAVVNNRDYESAKKHNIQTKMRLEFENSNQEVPKVYPYKKDKNKKHADGEKMLYAENKSSNKLYAEDLIKHYDYLSFENKEYTSTMNKVNERLATHDSMNEDKALFDKIMVLKALQAQHNSRGFFNWLFNFRKYAKETTLIDTLDAQIKTNKKYIELTGEHKNVEEYLFYNVVVPEIDSKINAHDAEGKITLSQQHKINVNNASKKYNESIEAIQEVDFEEDMVDIEPFDSIDDNEVAEDVKEK